MSYYSYGKSRCQLCAENMALRDEQTALQTSFEYTPYNSSDHIKTSGELQDSDRRTDGHQPDAQMLSAIRKQYQ